MGADDAKGAPTRGAPPAGRIETLSLARPWVANASTILLAVGVLLVLLAIIRVL